MAKYNKGIPKKRGRPPTGRDPVVPVRLPKNLIKNIDSWGARQSEPADSRSEAIRRLVELGFSASAPMKQTSPKEAAKAAGMAGRQIDKIGDSSATDEERQQRKRQLIKGPREFRDMRGDQAKPKS
jgi:hypothetical protein